MQVAFLTGGASLLDSLFLCLYAHAPALTALCTATGVTRAEEPPPPPPPADDAQSGIHVVKTKRPPQPPGPIVRGACVGCGRKRRRVSVCRAARPRRGRGMKARVPIPIIHTTPSPSSKSPTDAVTSDPAHAPALALLALVLGALKTIHGFRKVRSVWLSPP